MSDSNWSDVRVDVLDAKGAFDRTEHIGKSAIYRITEISKEVAFRLALEYAPEPSFAWSLKYQNQLHDGKPDTSHYENDNEDY